MWDKLKSDFLVTIYKSQNEDSGNEEKFTFQSANKSAIVYFAQNDNIILKLSTTNWIVLSNYNNYVYIVNCPYIKNNFFCQPYGTKFA